MSGPETAEGWVLKLARERPRLSPSELHILMTLAARHNRDHQCAWPKLELIVRETHYSERQVVRILNALSLGERPVLHISYAPLPTQPRNGRSTNGNVYRFVGFDPIPADAPPRRQLGGHPHGSVDTMSTPAVDTMSTQSVDTGDTLELTPAHGSVDTGDTLQLTSANSPLEPGWNPVKEPGLNPVARTRARDEPEFETLKVTPKEAPKPTESITCFGCSQTVDTIGYRQQHAPGCDYYGLYPFEIRARRGMLRERERRAAARQQATPAEQMAAGLAATREPVAAET